MSLLSARKSFETFAEEIEMGDKETPVEINELTRLILLGRAHDPILTKSYSNIHGKSMRKIINKAHKDVLKQYQADLITKKLMLKLVQIVSKNAPKMPYWIAVQPTATINGLYDKIVQPSKDNAQMIKDFTKENPSAKELANNFYVNLWGLGKKKENGYYNVYKKDKTNCTIFKIKREYEWYWKHYVGQYMFFDVKNIEETVAYCQKKVDALKEENERIKAEKTLKKIKGETEKEIQLPAKADRHISALIENIRYN